MPSYTRPSAVTAPLGHWTNVALLECHDYAPLISNILHSLSAEYGDGDGWVDARYASPGAILRTLGPVAQAMRLTKPQAAAVLDALAANGHMERSEEGAVRMVGLVDLVERSSAAAVRIFNSARQREIHERRIKHLADKSMLTVEPSTLTVEASTLPQAPSTLTPEPATGHDAPAGSLQVQDGHYLGIPSGCSSSNSLILGEGGVGEGGLPSAPVLTLVPALPVPKARKKAPPKPPPTKDEVIRRAVREIPNDNLVAWGIFDQLVDTRWPVARDQTLEGWQFPHFDPVHTALKLAQPQYANVAVTQIGKAETWLLENEEVRPRLGMFLLNWYDNEVRRQENRRVAG